MKKLPVLLMLLFSGLLSVSQARPTEVISPDKRFRVSLICSDSLEIRVTYDGRLLVGRSRIGLDIDNHPTSEPVVERISRR